MSVLIAGLICLGLYLTLYVLYDLFLIFVHFLVPEKESAATPPETHFKVLVPAHNEELFLPRLIGSVQKQDYPKHMFEVIVISDNCTDKTSLIARQEGVRTIERTDPSRRGKGHAIHFGIGAVQNEPYDAILIIDSDSLAEKQVLASLDAKLKTGHKIIQCYNGVANPNESWFTRIMDVSRTIGNEVLLPAKEKIGLSSHLMGNGMCFSREIVQKYGWDSFTIGEDWEYYAKVIRKDEIVGFAEHARVYHQESVSVRQATSQRVRWSSGRFAIAGNYGIALLYEGMKSLSSRKMDASLTLLLPNPSLGMNLTVLGLLGSLPVEVKSGLGLSIWFACLTLFQLGFFCIGVWHTQRKLENFLSIFISPIFLLWKMGIDVLSVLGLGRKTWIRTERKPG